MKTLNQLHFIVAIKAPKETVWQILWNDETYRKWTAVFSEGSYAVSEWNKNGKVHFLSPSGDGMFSVISELIPNSQMTFRHDGILKDFKEMPADEETRQWAGANESYTLNQRGDVTTLEVHLDINEQYENHFKDVFPKALEKVKQLSESKHQVN